MKAEAEKALRCLLAMQRHSWEQGLAMQALYEWGKMEQVVCLAYEAVYRRTEDGRAASIGVFDAVTDPCAVGEALLAACEMTKDEILKEGRDALLEWALNKAPRSEQGVLYHLNTGCQFWVDSMYMLPPFLAAAGYYEEALTNFYGYYEALYDRKCGLMSHMWDDEKGEYIRKAHWGTGNGWALSAMVRMQGLLPESYAEDRKKIRRMACGLLESAVKYMRDDGLFHDVIDERETFAETNFSQMMSYSIYRGLTEGWLDRGWEAKAAFLRKAANRKMNAYGFICDVCGAPTFDKPGISPEGQAFYLLMEHAAAKYAEGKER
ncbi:MAG: glycoside hydrolase family 88 protein [Lachnospiraceae bacterium]|nr:glycoside hydrolase family 88 protein [Lachnospiraceae bacterium]